MSDDYGYINARIRAMRSFLLKEEDYLEALREKTPDEFNSFLSSRASYAQDFQESLITQSVSSLGDEALKLNLCRIFKKMLRFSEGEPQKLMLILLGWWDIYNLKTIIRGILGFKDKTEIIQALIPAGRWDLEFLKQLAGSKDLKALANNLVMRGEDGFEKELACLIRGYSEDPSLEILENSLQEIYFKRAQESLSKGNRNARIIWDYLILKIDFLNISSVLKNIPDLHSEGLKFIPFGALSDAFLKDLMSLKSITDALQRFTHSCYPWLASEGLDLYKRTLRLSSLERLLEKKLFSFAYDLYVRGDPLSMSIPLAFINFKENEISNLRLIGKAIHFKLPQDLLKEELVYAG